MNIYILCTALDSVGKNMTPRSSTSEVSEERLRNYIEGTVGVCTPEEGCLCEIHGIEISDNLAKVRMGCPKLDGNLIRVDIVVDLGIDELKSAVLRFALGEMTVKITSSEYPEAYERLEDVARCIAWVLKQPIAKIVEAREIMDAVNNLYEKCMIRKYEIEE